MQTLEDKFDAELTKMIAELRECQKEYSLSSCSKCEKFLECELRRLYVKTVYRSMSKGDLGGFEF
ncbi:MAG: hypothetical protein WCR69_01645 [Sulfuricurvum sp.]